MELNRLYLARLLLYFGGLFEHIKVPENDRLVSRGRSQNISIYLVPRQVENRLCVTFYFRLLFHFTTLFLNKPRLKPKLRKILDVCNAYFFLLSRAQ